MPLIAITREMGSLGIEVAEQVARELKLPVIHHEVIDHLAEKMRLRKSHVERLLDSKAGIIRRHFGVNWQDAELYDVVFNTERVSVDECVGEVLKLAENPAFAETPASQRRLADLKMAAVVKAALREHAPTRGAFRQRAPQAR